MRKNHKYICHALPKLMIGVCLGLLAACQPMQQTHYGLHQDTNNTLDLRNENIIVGSQEEISRLYRERVKNNSDGKIILRKTAYPEYPASALAAGIGGVVTIEFVVNKKGRVTQPVVVQSADEDFNRASLQCLKRWRFEPVLKDGKPVDTKLRHTFRFVIKD